MEQSSLSLRARGMFLVILATCSSSPFPRQLPSAFPPKFRISISCCPSRRRPPRGKKVIMFVGFLA